MKNQQKHFDIAVVGGGIIGLAHAIMALERGLSVILFEKDEMAVGASIRNFGLVWPIGQPQGKLFDRAMNSRNKWMEMAGKADYWAKENGSFHLAYHDDEAEVLEEYHGINKKHTKLLNAKEVLQKAPNVNGKGLKKGLFSETEVNVNPKKAIYALTRWLETQPGGKLKKGVKVLHVQKGEIQSTDGTFFAEHILVCSGSDFQSLFPDAFEDSGMIKSKLQMMRTVAQPEDYQLGPTLCGGLTLRHYASFAECGSLEAYKQRISAEFPEFDEWGIHVMVSQNEYNELVIGDSHEYGYTFDPFLKKEINDYILDYLDSFLAIHHYEIMESWYGVYAKHPEKTEFVAEPEEGIHIITGFGGAGMTFSFGFAMEFFEGL